MSLPYNGKVLDNAKDLRKEMTRQEKHLWYDFLRSYYVRFQRQKTIGNYVADFYCHSAKLVIEIDGLQHYSFEAYEYEKNRTEYLNSLGIMVLRYKNSEIDGDFRRVCIQIDHIVKQRRPLPDASLSEGGGAACRDGGS